MKGKAYANRKPLSERPEADFYRTPESLTQALIDHQLVHKAYYVHEPAAGDGAIQKVLQAAGYNCTAEDIRTTGKDFLEDNTRREQIVTNPPFSLFDEFVEHARDVCSDQYIMLGKMNFFGAYGRTQKHLWKYLREVRIFNRQIDYRTPAGKGGHFHVGNLVTGWFIFDKTWGKNYWHTSILDVQPYATLGAYKEEA